jgi:hypothetical protein
MHSFPKLQGQNGVKNTGLWGGGPGPLTPFQPGFSAVISLLFGTLKKGHHSRKVLNSNRICTCKCLYEHTDSAIDPPCLSGFNKCGLNQLWMEKIQETLHLCEPYIDFFLFMISYRI